MKKWNEGSFLKPNSLHKGFGAPPNFGPQISLGYHGYMKFRLAPSFWIFVFSLALDAKSTLAETKPTPHPEKKETPSKLFETTTPSTPITNPSTPAPCEQLPQLSTKDLWTVSECHYEKRNFEKTIDVLREIRRRDVHELDAYFTTAWLLWRMGTARGGADETRFVAEAIKELQEASSKHPTNWKVFTEVGDFYFLRLNQPDKAYAEYLNARKYYKGDFSRKSTEASKGQKAAIEARIGRTSEKIGRKGEAVEASCRALFLDPDDKGSEDRVNRLFGSCDRKKVKDPLIETKKKDL